MDLNSRLNCLIKAAIDLGDFIDPLLPLRMFQGQDVGQRPMKMIGDVGYLLVQTLKGVASYSPSVAKSTSTSCPSGQVTLKVVVPSSLICRYNACR